MEFCFTALFPCFSTGINLKMRSLGDGLTKFKLVDLYIFDKPLRMEAKTS